MPQTSGLHSGSLEVLSKIVPVARQSSPRLLPCLSSGAINDWPLLTVQLAVLGGAHAGNPSNHASTNNAAHGERAEPGYRAHVYIRRLRGEDAKTLEYIYNNMSRGE